MQPLSQFKGSIKVLFTDIDDTLTWQGQLPPQSYEMLWKLQESGIQIVPVTGRPAGWCEMIARMWHVSGVVGENGAFYFQYLNKKMTRVFGVKEEERIKNQQKLQKIKTEILEKIEGTAVASDQFTRLFDLAIDFCEDVEPLGPKQVDQIVGIFKRHGATAKVSSIHVNGWFGNYDKRSMCEVYYQNNFGKSLANSLNDVAFVGDSPNDEPLFDFFENSFAVANILNFKDQLKSPPKFVAPSVGAKGFVEVAKLLLKNK